MGAIRWSATGCPIYGDFFKEHDVSLKRGSGQPIMTSQPIADLAVLLQFLQQYSSYTTAAARTDDIRQIASRSYTDHLKVHII